MVEIKNHMINQTLVILPARGGSKRIRKKNIFPLYGKPMIHWPLEVLVEIFPLQNILLSTDDSEIKACVENFNILTEYNRPKHLSDDYTTSLNIINDALNWFRKKNSAIKYVLVVYPTAVLLKKDSILKAFSIMRNGTTDATLAATNFGFPIQRGFSINLSGQIKYSKPEYFKTRSQDLETFYHDAGQFYLIDANKVSDNLDLSAMRVSAVKLKRNEVVDIDEQQDLELAELFLRYKDEYN